MSLFENIKQLHQAELYGDLKLVASLVLSLSENNPDADVLSFPQKYQCQVYYGDALFHQGEYKKAEVIYRKSLQLKKAINKTKGKHGSPADVSSEVEVKFKLYQCLDHLKRTAEALNVLESISTKQRTAKVNLALAKLNLREGRDRSAMTCYKEVVREQPLALDAAVGLLSLGMKGADVASLITNNLPHGTNVEWLHGWLKGHAQLAAKEYTTAVSTFRNMEKKTCLRDNVQLLNCVGEAMFYDGRYADAMSVFQRVHSLDPLCMKNMDLFAYLLSQECKVSALSQLSQKLMGISESCAEPWIAMGYYSMLNFVKSKERSVRAVYFAQKAYTVDPRSIQALLLKASSLLDLKKLHDATLHYLEAVRLAPHRFEAYSGLIECYLTTHRIKDGLTWASRMIRTLGNSARTFTLYASVLSKDSNTVAKAEPYLLKAIEMDPSYLEAVYILADIIAQGPDHQRGIKLIQQHLISHNTARLHQILGDFLALASRHQEAMDEYSITLTMQPFNKRAQDGMQRLEKHNEGGLENSYDVEVEMGGSDNDDADFEGSDMESTWSETDFS
ncbi:anaphase-promoting complex subunit 7-like isoform X2 [Gigantopelta aegis]|uniref:anaphase-promoting complex subunit 7-like isoform X2 n=1 Tax=Gigantopelta aegis TaxID=1735272 RepID=UPI001B88A964|nr:anaphase-promoting complex subunit 7-like isoform X2 [Gigantopelta aegis]